MYESRGEKFLEDGGGEEHNTPASVCKKVEEGTEPSLFSGSFFARLFLLRLSIQSVRCRRELSKDPCQNSVRREVERIRQSESLQNVEN